MKNFILFLILAFFAFSAKAKSFFLYGSLQAQRSYTELGESDTTEVKYHHHLDQIAYGLGGEWRFEDDGSFFFGAGAHYQPSLKVEQNTTHYNQNQNPSSFTSKKDLPRIGFLHGYFNVYNRVADSMSFFLGSQISAPDLKTRGRFDDYKMKPDLGYRIGIEMNLYKAWTSQLYYRHVVLETEDENDYEGEIDISSLMFSLGRLF